MPVVKKVTDAKRTANVYAISDGQNNTIPIPKDFYYVGGNQIKKYGGFYIGRYEAGVSVLDKSTGTFKDNVTFGESSLNGHVVGSKDSHGWVWQNTNYLARNSNMTSLLGSKYGENKANGNIVVQADTIPHYHADYYTAMEMSERLYSNKNSVSSGLVTGTQWDMMMKYMQDNENAVLGENCNWGNYDDTVINEITGYYIEVDSNGTTSIDGFRNGSEYSTNSTQGTCIILTTGASEKVKKMNLYDVAGNLWEWTYESAYYNNTHSDFEYDTGSIRGGHLLYNFKLY